MNIAKFLFIQFFLLTTFSSFSQQSISLSITITDLHLKYSVRGGTDPRVKFFDKRTNQPLNPKEADGLNCMHFVDTKEADITTQYALLPIMIQVPVNNVITIGMEAFEKNKKKGDCDFNANGLFNKDNHHEFGEFVIDLKNLKPGVNSEKISASTSGGLFRIEFIAKYSLPEPDSIKTNDANNKFCFQQKVIATTGASALPNTSGVLYKWEYYKQTSANWELITVSDNPSLETDATNLGLEAPKINSKIPLRVSLMTKEELGKPANKTIEFMPDAPTLQAKKVNIVNTCANKEEGGIIITNIKGLTNNYTFILRDINTTSICYPESNTPCKESDKIVSTTSDNLSFEKIKAGKYTLFTTNTNANAGACYQRYEVTVGEHPKLEEIKKLVKPVSCIGATDGEIIIETRGGHPAPFHVSINPNIGNLSLENRQVKLTKLPAGKYTVSILDSCMQKIESNVTIIEPTLPKIEIANLTNSTCIKNQNGSFVVNVVSGVGPFIYALYKDDRQIIKTDKTNNPSWNFSNLQFGDYKVLAYGNGNDSCIGVEKKIKIENGAIEIPVKLVKLVSATCDDCKNGSLQFSTGDLKSTVQFTLTNETTKQIMSNTTGQFENLQVGKYSLMVKLTDNNCTESQVFPDPLSITSTPTTIVDTTIKKQ
jgi:hypothetical protein